MFDILKMSSLDLFWGVPFLCLSIMAMTCYLDALFKVLNITARIESHKKERSCFLKYFRSGRIVNPKEVIDSSQDPVICASASVINACAQNRIKDYSVLKSDIRDSLNSLLKVPHEGIFSFFCGVILSLGFGGTTFSFFHLLANFDINTSDFSQLFRYLSVGIKSSFFGVVASILMSSGHVWLEKKVEGAKEKFIHEDFYQNLIWIFNNSTAETNKQIVSSGNNGKKIMLKQGTDSGSNFLQNLTKRKKNIASLIKTIQIESEQVKQKYVNRPEVWQEMEERFTKKINQLKKESYDIELQITELECTVK